MNLTASSNIGDKDTDLEAELDGTFWSTSKILASQTNNLGSSQSQKWEIGCRPATSLADWHFPLQSKAINKQDYLLVSASQANKKLYIKKFILIEHKNFIESHSKF